MLSVTQLIIILVIVLLIFGPSRLEKLGPSIGRAIKGFKDGLKGEQEKESDQSHGGSGPKDAQQVAKSDSDGQNNKKGDS